MKDFIDKMDDLSNKFLSAPIIEAKSWQSTKAPDNMVELHGVDLKFKLDGFDLEYYRETIKPNLPWADEHFIKERVSGQPINPGVTWRIWPFSASANTHRDGEETLSQYDHSYAERYWPKFAGTTKGGLLEFTPKEVNKGYRFDYGDLDDLVDVLISDPLTRQAYLPIWFPEDLDAAKKGKRVPCSLGYHFIRRDDQLHIYYPMRSCDYIRHFRDDIYLTIRLLLWVIEQCKLGDPENWYNVTPGIFSMHIVSLHMFKRDRDLMAKYLKPKNKGI